MGYFGPVVLFVPSEIVVAVVAEFGVYESGHIERLITELSRILETRGGDFGYSVQKLHRHYQQWG